jgi:hypothetical protein
VPGSRGREPSAAGLSARGPQNLRLVWMRKAFLGWRQWGRLRKERDRHFLLVRCFSSWKLYVKRVRAVRDELARAQ